jgi:hypothetical protein
VRAWLRSDSFGGTVLFGALTALAWPAWALTASALGLGTGLSGYLVCVSAAYAAGLAATSARAAGGALWTLGFGTLVVLLARGPADVAIGTALAVGICRSGLLETRRPARALLLETALLGAGLAAARFLAGPGLLGVSLALWGFFLVQSLGFLVGGREARTDTPGGVDPFDYARGRALEILDE